MECRVFPKGDYQGIWELLKYLRDVFGKSLVTEEDSLRLRSIRNAGVWRSAGRSAETSPDDLLKSAEACIVFDSGQVSHDARAFELVNKTNQFNLNGKRFSDSEWRNFFSNPAAFLFTVSYKDKYGPLGKIAVVMGKMHGSNVHVSNWVMSCRAFSRRIEDQCLKYLFETLGADEITFDYQATPRNSPMQEFLTGLLVGPPAPGMSLTRDQFVARVPPLFHCVEVTVHV
jgi:FkbH-like protein